MNVWAKHLDIKTQAEMPISHNSMPVFATWFQLLSLISDQCRLQEVALMAQVGVPLLPKWETWIQFLVPGCSMAQSQPLCAFDLESVCLTHSLFLLKNECMNAQIASLHKAHPFSFQQLRELSSFISSSHPPHHMSDGTPIFLLKPAQSRGSQPPGWSLNFVFVYTEASTGSRTS